MLSFSFTETSQSLPSCVISIPGSY
ncbi:hypothetical protein E2C01_065848 [Portunus trituberculatus]|uniref:Uncharacterized protein n=1 Tax=Portunus trituberculatus TaxID=210409 RepID=A0A5B7HPE8_PORTR|nr:hypothetical protein [Portunus trituberculatus]